MRVKRLEIQGFKSFKDKTVIHFDHSITGIVGPNGCGKSNIVDAFFWVMGEQSYKHMRGNCSEDLIFNGSSKYTPLGMAEATLVMETPVMDTARAPAGATVHDIPLALQTKEISVTRRLYRSGEGEYFINGTLARLKDIQELFMDTGVGAKGYSVIEQGQIGKIVNSKPEERRLLIEEAAGIAKYKARKKESLRKMEATQANLARLMDIIQEIDRNLSSLERQAQKAKLYKKYKDELLDKELTWGNRRFQAFREKLDALRKQHEASEHELAAMRAELQTTENSIEVDRVDLLTETKEAESLQAKIQDFSHQLSQEQSALELSRHRQGDLASQLQSLAQEKQELQTSLSSNTLQIAEQQRQSDEATQLFEQAAAEVSQMNAVLSQSRKEVEKARSHLDSSQRELISEMTQISHLNSRCASLQSKAESARTQAERLSSQIEEQTQKILTIREELEESKTVLKSTQEKRGTLQGEHQKQSGELKTQEQDLRQLETKRNESLRSLTQLRSRLQSLEELSESHEGLADGPKAVLDWAKATGKGHQIAAFADTLNTSSGYESVLESWLENRIGYLMIKDPSLILPLLEKIQQDKQGRVSLQWTHSNLSKTEAALVSGSGGDWATVRTLLESHGFKVLGQLSDFVKSDSADFASLSYLIDSVCVVESLSPMVTLLESDKFGKLSPWSLVSMDGSVLESEGVIRAGSGKTSGAVALLRRKRAIEELKEQVSQASVQHGTIEETIAGLKQGIEALQSNLRTSQSELQASEIQSARLDRDIHQMDRAFQEAKIYLNSLEKNSHEMTLEADEALAGRASVESQLQELVSLREELEENITSSERDVLEKEDLLRTQETAVQATRVKEAALRERVVSLKRETEAAQSLLADRQRRWVEVERTLDRATREQGELSGGESQLAQKVEELTLFLGHTREKLAEVKDRIEQSNAEVNHALDLIKDLHKRGDQKATESTQLALEMEKLSGEISHLVLNLEEKYGQGCLDRQQNTQSGEGESEQGADEETSKPSTELSPEEELALGEEVERLRERIRRLGEVNVMAIEEYDQLKKRYDHLLSEKSDLEHSLENLEDAIQHINKTSEERFKKAFEAIAERFERLFPIIFGGGQAKLSLLLPENSTDILEAGVDILAQPPGKKIANITLLSGGEKALTAVSLIFAIFMVKPSPFCVLDEVDAPLDDANIGKFNALLREMASKSQFILITHNKKTMELNDTLYGVTMEEPGVSKMVSIEMH